MQFLILAQKAQLVRPAVLPFQQVRQHALIAVSVFSTLQNVFLFFSKKIFSQGTYTGITSANYSLLSRVS